MLIFCYVSVSGLTHGGKTPVDRGFLLPLSFSQIRSLQVKQEGLSGLTMNKGKYLHLIPSPLSCPYNWIALREMYPPS